MTEYHVLNLGAGLQSTTLYLIPLLGDGPETEPVLDFGDGPDPVPWFDAAIFADTGDEPDAVYRHVRWLLGLGGPPIVLANVGAGVIPHGVFLEFVGRLDADGRRAADHWLDGAAPGFVRLGDSLIRGMNATGQRFVSIPAFTSAVEGCGGGLIRRQCTREFKTDVVERAIRRGLLGLAPGRPVPPGVVVHQYLGLSRDEHGRVTRVKARFAGVRWARPRFPLYDRHCERADCAAYLAPRVPHPVPRSACVYCPFHGDEEWRAQRDGDPAGWARALEVDAAIRGPDAARARKLDQKLYLHRSCLPLDRAPLDGGPGPALGRFAIECEGLCGN